MNKMEAAAALLETEALLMLTRATLLLDDPKVFMSRLFEARAKFDEFAAKLVKANATSELFVAVQSVAQRKRRR